MGMTLVDKVKRIEELLSELEDLDLKSQTLRRELGQLKMEIMQIGNSPAPLDRRNKNDVNVSAIGRRLHAEGSLTAKRLREETGCSAAYAHASTYRIRKENEEGGRERDE